jgi:(p)ppGpp synthase/HD superfamily hydrolase
LSGSSFGSDEINLIRAAYDEASILFAGAVRGSGRSFVDHVIGTASGTLLGGGDAVAVAAALLHAAYEMGDFGGWRAASRRQNRTKISSRFGSEVEEIVYRYHEMGWGPEVAQRVLEGIECLSCGDRTVVLIRVANALDDVLDGALVISSKESLGEFSRETLDVVGAIAQRIAEPALVECLDKEFKLRPPKIRQELILGRKWSRVLLPRSARTNLTTLLVRRAARLWKRFRRRVRATWSRPK